MLRWEEAKHEWIHKHPTIFHSKMWFLFEIPTKNCEISSCVWLTFTNMEINTRMKLRQRDPAESKKTFQLRSLSTIFSRVGFVFVVFCIYSSSSSFPSHSLMFSLVCLLVFHVGFQLKCSVYLSSFLFLFSQAYFHANYFPKKPAKNETYERKSRKLDCTWVQYTFDYVCVIYVTRAT